MIGAIEFLKKKDMKKINWDQVPDYFYSIVFLENDPSNEFELKVIEHKNALNLEYITINSLMNCYGHKAHALSAKQLISDILNKKTVLIP